MVIGSLAPSHQRLHSHVLGLHHDLPMLPVIPACHRFRHELCPAYQRFRPICRLRVVVPLDEEELARP